MNAKTVTVLLISLIASIPAFAFLASVPAPIVAGSPDGSMNPTVYLPAVHIAADPVVVVPETKVVVFKAKRYASLIDMTASNQPPCGAGFWTTKRNCKVGSR